MLADDREHRIERRVHEGCLHIFNRGVVVDAQEHGVVIHRALVIQGEPGEAALDRCRQVEGVLGGNDHEFGIVTFRRGGLVGEGGQPAQAECAGGAHRERALDRLAAGEAGSEQRFLQTVSHPCNSSDVHAAETTEWLARREVVAPPCPGDSPPAGTGVF